MDDATAITLFNTIILVVMLGSIIALISGAVINAMREKKGQPVKKRTRFIVLEVGAILLCAWLYNIFAAQK